MDSGLKEMLPALFGGRSKRKKMRVADALDYLISEEENKLVDMDQVTRIALERVERNGIVFLDEVDKIAGREGGQGPDVSREGVQRDILPIVEGTTVNTRYGFVRTDHILFIAAGAFHVSKPSDLIPELQGRFPIRVELKALTEADFIRIMKEPKCALVTQYIALMDTEGIKLTFTEDSLAEMARIATQLNQTNENIGARRLHTIMERVLEEISFEGPDLKKKNVKIDAAYVKKQLAPIMKDEDLSKYIL
jgi:ATP-dependent HslUV protease ATP-binding subunit HslU